MSFDGISKRVSIRRIYPLCAIIAHAFLSSLPVGVAAQLVDDRPVLTPGLHNLELPRADGPAIRYAISIPDNYSPGTPVPLILALHFGVRGGDAAGAGGDVVQILIGPALSELGAIIVAPDSVRGDWSSPENEKAVNALLDMVLEKFPERFSAAIPVAGRPPSSPSGWRLPVLAIHSYNDQVVPFAPTEVRIAELQKAGVNAKLIPLTGVTHYETHRFAGALRQAIPWLREVWK
jgi:hypothetical protein